MFFSDNPIVIFAQVLGLEPRPTVLETVVLPLNYTCLYHSGCKFSIFFLLQQLIL